MPIFSEPRVRRFLAKSHSFVHCYSDSISTRGIESGDSACVCPRVYRIPVTPLHPPWVALCILYTCNPTPPPMGCPVYILYLYTHKCNPTPPPVYIVYLPLKRIIWEIGSPNFSSQAAFIRNATYVPPLGEYATTNAHQPSSLACEG